MPTYFFVPEEKNTEKPIIQNKVEITSESTSQQESVEQHEAQDSILNTSNMEVHHHPHLHPKPWKEYFLEFIMIFLAVLMGFFAENIRERTANKEKERHYIQSLTEDIKSDIVQLNNYIRFTTDVRQYCDSLQFIISHTDVFQNSDSFYTYSRELARYMRYYPADRTIAQLRNGNMQLIHNWNVSNAISEYYSKTKFMEEVDQELNDEAQIYRRYLIETLDLSSYDNLNRPGSYMDNDVHTKGNPGFISLDAAKIKIIYNEAFALKSFLYNCGRNATELANDANDLLALLNKEY